MKKINIKKWLLKNTHSLVGKTVVITGSTGGLGVCIAENLAKLGANLILVDRNFSKSQGLANSLAKKYNGINIVCITADFSDFVSVRNATERLKEYSIDVFIHNAGAYSIPRYKTELGFDNVFQINFVSPYYIIRELLPLIKKQKGRVVTVGSIAHNYSKSDKNDIDFSTKKAASKVYGNAKRYLMFSLFELFKCEEDVSLAVTHPGITFTNITAHYPKLIFAIIKNPMKIIFMKPEKAVLSIIKGVFCPTPYNTWFGPRIFGIWGKPKLSKLNTCNFEEVKDISITAENIYKKLKEKAYEVNPKV